jgi:hypothetical protein
MAIKKSTVPFTLELFLREVAEYGVYASAVHKFNIRKQHHTSLRCPKCFFASTNNRSEGKSFLGVDSPRHGTRAWPSPTLGCVQLRVNALRTKVVSVGFDQYEIDEFAPRPCLQDRCCLLVFITVQKRSMSRRLLFASYPVQTRRFSRTPRNEVFRAGALRTT